MNQPAPRLHALPGTFEADQGEAWAWLREAIAEHGGMLWRFVLPRVAGMTHTADGVLQETWQALAAQPIPPREMGAWLRGTARHKILDQFRRERRRTFWEVPLELLTAHGPDPELVIEEQWQSERVHRALQALPTRFRQALVLHYLEGWSVVELAALQSRSPKAIECQLYRARVAFRETYRKQADD